MNDSAKLPPLLKEMTEVTFTKIGHKKGTIDYQLLDSMVEAVFGEGVIAGIKKMSELLKPINKDPKIEMVLELTIMKLNEFEKEQEEKTEEVLDKVVDKVN